MKEGGPFQCLRVDSCLTLGNELSMERSAIQMRDFFGKGYQGGGQEGEGNRENCSSMWLTVSGFMVIGLVSCCLLPVILNWDPSWGHMHHSAKMDSSEEDPGKLVGPLHCSLPSLFDLSRILVGGSLLVACSLPGPPV